ncbi:MAG: hypothetical protein H0Z37_02210 [Firmicutes bacterium]|nr:hypothetical protein [Bacillota bacterium]
MFAATFDGWSGVARMLAAVLFTGLAVKLMDDCLDRDTDELAGRITLAARTGDGAMAYALAALAAAALADGVRAGTLFLAAYAVGMSHDWRRRLPSGLCGWHESALAVAAGSVLAGPWAMLAALAAIFAVQCIDDLADAAEDRLRGARSLVFRLGAVETAGLGVAALLLGLAIEPLFVTSVVAAAPVIGGVMEWSARRWPAEEGGLQR